MMYRHTSTAVILALAASCWLCITASVNAQFIDPNTITVMNTGPGSDVVTPDNLLNNGTVVDNNSTFAGNDDDIWLADPNSNNLVFDFGSDVALGDIVLWNYSHTDHTNGSAEIGVSDFLLSFATEAEGTGGFGTSISDTPNFFPLQVSDGTSIDGQPFDFDDVLARYVRLTTFDSHDAGAADDFIGLHEVRFNQGEVVVPEPSSVVIWSMLILLGLGYGIWRKRK